MKLTALRLHNVRRFAGTGVRIENIGDGINVLCAANEHGKSTCFDALHALFFQLHTGTPGAVQALRPYSGGNPLVEADIMGLVGIDLTHTSRTFVVCAGSFYAIAEESVNALCRVSGSRGRVSSPPG